MPCDRSSREANTDSDARDGDRTAASGGLTRRRFLKSGALLLAGGAMLPGVLARAALASPARSEGRRVLVVVFQRGAADGLSMVVPFREAAYARVRPTIALAPPSAAKPEESVLDLDGTFGLHPALAAFKPLYQEGSLAIVHATGSPDPTRSHFDAQDFMESAAPGRKSVSDGWLNRCLASRRREGAPLRAVAMTSTLPRSLQGLVPAVAIPDLRGFGVRGSDAELVGHLEGMYTRADDAVLRAAGRESFDAMATVRKVMADASLGPAHGAAYAGNPFAQGLQQVARLIKAGVGLEVACLDVQGWDTHANQGAARGPLATLLRGFAEALAAFRRDLGDAMEDVTVLTMSEFGRRVEENGTGGTDHGHGGCSFILGGRVKGGRVYTRWPGLERASLFEGRDLAVTTDFRDVWGEVVASHLGAPPSPSIFPGYALEASRRLGLMKG